MFAVWRITAYVFNYFVVLSIFFIFLNEKIQIFAAQKFALLKGESENSK